MSIDSSTKGIKPESGVNGQVDYKPNDNTLVRGIGEAVVVVARQLSYLFNGGRRTEQREYTDSTYRKIGVVAVAATATGVLATTGAYVYM